MPSRNTGKLPVPGNNNNNNKDDDVYSAVTTASHCES